jgi:hypothetical protein
MYGADLPGERSDPLKYPDLPLKIPPKTAAREGADERIILPLR